jgi:hypothetical protein
MSDPKDQSEFHENPAPEVLASDGGSEDSPGACSMTPVVDHFSSVQP